jgi:hypothetical protein
MKESNYQIGTLPEAREKEHERLQADNERGRHDAHRDLRRADIGIDGHIGGLWQESKP